jgi:hypothetical protein
MYYDFYLCEQMLRGVCLPPSESSKILVSSISAPTASVNSPLWTTQQREIFYTETSLAK